MKKLFISQPTVSQAIKELEQHYHVILFDRLSKKLFLTEAYPWGAMILFFK